MTHTAHAPTRKPTQRSARKKIATSAPVAVAELAEAACEVASPFEQQVEATGSLSRPMGGIAAQTRDRFVDDLQILFEAALISCSYASALKAKELIGKERGFFQPRKEQAPLANMDVLSTSDLEGLVENMAVSVPGKASKGHLAS